MGAFLFVVTKSKGNMANGVGSSPGGMGKPRGFDLIVLPDRPKQFSRHIGFFAYNRLFLFKKPSIRWCRGRLCSGAL
jgi:hypothetical protein